MVAAITWGLLAIGLFIVIPALIAWFIWEKTFRYKCFIAKQTGNDPDNVVWFEDKFKVLQKEGYYRIIFRRQISQSQSFPGELWSKFFRNKSIKFDNNRWMHLNIPKHIARGLFLYQTTEGEYHPMRLERDGVMKTLSQDNRAFLVHQFKKSAELALTPRKQIIAIAAVIGGIVILGICFVLFLVYLTDAAADICGTAGNTFIDTATNTIGG